MKIIELIEAVPVLQRINAQRIGGDGKLIYALTRNANAIDQELVAFQTAARALRDGLVGPQTEGDAPALLDAEGRPADPDTARAFEAALREMEQVEVAPKIYRVSIEQLGRLELSPAELSRILWMVEEPVA